MMTSECCNDIVLEGKVLAAPAPSHENHGVRFFRFFLEVPRLSGQADTLPVLIPEPMVQQVCQGETVRVRGQLRSFNNRSGVGSRLVLTVYGQEVLPPCGEAANHIAHREPLQSAHLPAHAPGPHHLRSHAGSAPPVRPHGLSAGHRLGTAGPAGAILVHRGTDLPGGTAPKPHLSEGHGIRHGGAGCLRGVHDAPGIPT